MQQLIETYINDNQRILPEITRIVISPQEFYEGSDRVQYGFVAYRGKKSQVGEFRGHSAVVEIDAYGIFAMRVVTSRGREDVQHLKIGVSERVDELPFLSAKGSEIYFVLNYLEKLRLPSYNDLISFILWEADKFERFYEKTAQRVLKETLGLSHFNPFQKSNKKSGFGKGVDL